MTIQSINTKESTNHQISDVSENIVLNFSRPLKFTRGDNYLFTSEYVKNEGIYIWTIKDELNNNNYVHYIGETLSLGQRQKEHIIHMTGLNYQILDAESAKKGIVEIWWNGMWRDKSPYAVSNMLENYKELSKKAVDYISLINVYFAPTSYEGHVRKHIEGCLGWNFRKNYPELKKFYPDDNHVGRKKQLLGRKLFVNLPEAIAGIDREQMI